MADMIRKRGEKQIRLIIQKMLIQVFKMPEKEIGNEL